MALTFQKAIASLFLNLYKRAGEQCSICKTDGGKGRGIYLKKYKKRVHFLGQEKFVNFPRVNWLDMKNSNDDTSDLYAVIIKKNDKGNKFIDEANCIMQKKGITSKFFISLEDLVIKDFNEKTWDDLNRTMAEIEKRTKQYQWFGLVNYYNELTQNEYIDDVGEKLRTFDYSSRLLNVFDPIPKNDVQLLQQEFVEKNGYRVLLGEEDFCSSFITSEWLFDNIDIGAMLEKTYVVTGYIKSIEQLMIYLIRSNADNDSTIGIQSTGGIKNVDVMSDEFFNATLERV